MVKFNLYTVTDGTLKARVKYRLDDRFDGRKCVSIEAKDCLAQLSRLVPSNDNEVFDPFRRVLLFEGHPMYQAARTAAERMEEKSTGHKAPAWN